MSKILVEIFWAGAAAPRVQTEIDVYLPTHSHVVISFSVPAFFGMPDHARINGHVIREIRQKPDPHPWFNEVAVSVPEVAFLFRYSGLGPDAC